MNYIIDLRTQENHRAPEVDKKISIYKVIAVGAIALSLIGGLSKLYGDEKLNSLLLDTPDAIDNTTVKFPDSLDSILSESQKTNLIPNTMLLNTTSETAGSTSSILNTDNYELETIDELKQPADSEPSEETTDSKSISHTVTVSAQVLSETSCNEFGCTSQGVQLSSSTKNGITTYVPSI